MKPVSDILTTNRSFLVGQSRKISAWESTETLVRCLELSVSTGRWKNSRMAFIPSLATAASVFPVVNRHESHWSELSTTKTADGSGGSFFISGYGDTIEQIRQVLDMVGLCETVENLPGGIHAPCTERLFSQGQLHRTGQ